MKAARRLAARAGGFAVATLLALSPMGKPAFAQEAKVLNAGRIEYREQCAACHGESGMGEGKMADRLTVKPPDLTRIAKRNDGEFPFWTVYTIIDGEKPVQAHQLSPMPLWGARFREEEKHGAPPAYLRILALTHYLESIQEK